MLPGQYQQRSSMPSFPMDPFLYDSNNNTASPSQPSHLMASHDGLPRMQNTQPHQHFMTSPPSLPNFKNTYNLGNPLSMSQSSTPWAEQKYTGQFEDQNSLFYGYASNMSGQEHNDGFPRGGEAFSIPRFAPLPNMFSDNHNMHLEASFEPSVYMLDSNMPGMQSSNNHHSSSTYQEVDNREFGRLSICRSPGPKLEMDDTLSFDNAPIFGMPSSETSEGNSSREMTAVEAEEQNVDEPYAKLIYRALMSAPNHAMVLQEIYQWFRENTLKGSAESKGWMNSIRHNLSMNAAFKKTERKVPGEDTKKSTEWVLEDFAIKDGVQSTTRYRKGTGAKKFIKTENPTEARQLSGRKGGFSTKQAKVLRQQRMMSDERRHPMHGGVDTMRRAQFHSNNRPHVSRRQRSPLTPPSAEAVTSPYFFPKVEQFETFDDMYRLEDVSGADDGPLFTNSPDGHYHGGRLMAPY